VSTVPEEYDGDEPRPAEQGAPGADQAMLRDREAKALRLRRLGGTYDQIAREMGFADASGARQLIMRALDRVVAEGVVQLRSLENQRLDVTTSVLMGIATDAGKSSMERIRAVEAHTRVSARRSRLNGLDAPMQVQVTGGALSALDDALKLLEDVVMHDVIPGEVVKQDDDAEPGAGGGAAAGPGTGEG
jgi:hypothetical protein